MDTDIEKTLVKLIAQIEALENVEDQRDWFNKAIGWIERRRVLLVTTGDGRYKQ